MNKKTIPLAALAVAASWTSTASAETVRFAGTLEVGCTMMAFDGTLAPSANYTVLSTEEPGGKYAALTVYPLGGAVEIKFSPLIFTSTGSVVPDKTEIKWYSLNGFRREYSDPEPQSYLSNERETYHVDVRAMSESGFDAGNYEITTTATCSS